MIYSTGVRILVDVAEADLKALDLMVEREKVSRARLIREAISEFLARRPPASRPSEALGLWNAGEDGLEQQRRLRAEW